MRVYVAGLGATDAGVHALAQVAAFSIDNPIPLANLQRAVNRLLPPAIRLFRWKKSRRNFTRASTQRRRRTSTASCEAEICSPFDWPYVHHYPYPLDEDRMRELARVFEGEHDFTAFAAADESDASSDIDIVYLTGYGFPAYRGGPMFYADSIGLHAVLYALRRFAANPYADPGAWQPAPLLARLGSLGKTFNDSVGGKPT